MSKVKGNIKNHQDIFGRESDFQIVKIDDSYPVYLREHLEDYRYLMYPAKKSWLDKLLGR